MRWTLLLVVALCALLVALHLGGVRADLGILSGTRVASERQLQLAVLYVLAWFGVIVVAPVLLLARLLIWAARARGSIEAWIRSWRSSRAR